MTKHEPDKAEVLGLLEIIDGDSAPLDSKLLAIKRLEYILGKPILNTKEFKRIRDEFTNPVVEKSATGSGGTEFGAERPVEPKTKRPRHTPTRKKGRA